MSITSWILVALVVVHTGWIINHLRLHSEGVINPWKGGGYGMYTNLSPSQNFVIHTGEVFPVPVTRATWVKKPNTQPLHERNNIWNLNRFFKCRQVPPKNLKIFVLKNRNRLKRYVSITLKERYVDQETRSAKVRETGKIQLVVNNATASYRGVMCGGDPVEYTVNLRS